MQSSAIPRSSVLVRGLGAVAEDRRVILVLVLAAVLVRLAWVFATHNLAPLESELQRVAVALAERGVIADAYRDGSGPTSHVGPISAVPAALAYRLFGVATPAAEIVLTIVSALVIAATAVAGNAVFRRLGTPAALRGAAMLLILLAPIHVQLEAQDLRAREAGIAALLLMVMILLLLRADQSERVSWRQIVGLSLLGALLFVLSPAAALAAYSGCGVLALRRIAWRRWPATAAIAAVTLVALSLPWALRNQRVFGEMIWSRGNFGLEYAIGTNPQAVNPADPRAAFQATLLRLHPFRSDAAYRNMVAAGGEVAYARKLKDETDAWVAGHRGEAVRLWLKNWREFYLPPPWLYNPYGPVTASITARAWLVYALTLAAFAGVLAALWRRRWDMLYVALPLLLASAPYILVQPRLRYRYLIASLVIFAAFDALRNLRPRPALAEPGAMP